MQLQHMPSYYPRELGEGNVVGVERRSSFSSCPNKEEFFFLFFIIILCGIFFVIPCHSLVVLLHVGDPLVQSAVYLHFSR